MPYIRKTYDEWRTLQYTGPQYGWEEVSAYSKRSDAFKCLYEYRKNQPEYAVKMVKKRVKINAA